MCELGLEPAILGILIGSGGIGALAGALLTRPLIRHYGIGTVGLLMGGILDETIGLRSTLLLAVLGKLCAVLWLFFSPVRTIESPAEETRFFQKTWFPVWSSDDNFALIETIWYNREK